MCGGKSYLCRQQFIRVFTFPSLPEIRNTALVNPHSVVILTTGKKYFNSTDVVAGRFS